jgi:hypothetical protein
MARPKPGLGADPLARVPRINPVIPPTLITADPSDQQTTAEVESPRATTGGPVRAATVRRGRGAGEKTTSDRQEGSVARRGPMSFEPGAPKKSYGFYLDPDLLEEARDTVVFLSADPDGPRTLSALIEEGLRREIVRLQDELHAGVAFPHRRVALRRGGNTRDR